MIGAVGQQPGIVPGSEAHALGKRGGAIGQQAKAAVAAALEAGADIPRNAQGKAASAVARGVDPASLFAARVAAPETAREASDTVAGSSQGTDQAVVADPPLAGDDVPENNTKTATSEAVVVSEEPSLALLLVDAERNKAGA